MSAAVEPIVSVRDLTRTSRVVVRWWTVVAVAALMVTALAVAALE